MMVRIDSVSLELVGPSVTLALGPGRSLGIFGPTASGKSRLLRALSGAERPPRGTVKSLAPLVAAGIATRGRRATPLSIAKAAAGPEGATLAAEALSATHLWELRKSPLSDLTQSQAVACELLPVLSSQAGILAIDGQLDNLDIWVRQSVLALLGKRLRNGAALLFVSKLPELATRVDTLVVLHKGRIKFAGTYRQLEQLSRSTEVVVETLHQQGVRAIVDPYEISISQTSHGLRIKASEGQEIAAKLLLQGYGDVRAVVYRKPTPSELLRELLPE